METVTTIPNPSGGDDGSQRPDSSSPDWLQSASNLARDFLIDVLGSLIGIIFIIAVCALVITSGTCFLYAFGQGAQHNEPTFGLLLTRSVDSFHAWILFIVAYVVGGIFHRLDPKRPDRKSLERELRDIPKNGLKHYEVQTRVSGPESWRWRIRIRFLKLLDHILPRSSEALGRVEAARIASSYGARFPYSHIKAYLESRKLIHLARMVPWKSDKDWTGCSKMFINVLKIRMQWVAPRKCGEIVRNEAHVRMMSSVWYAAKAVISLIIVSLVPVLVAAWRLLSSGKSILDALTSHDFVVYGAVASFAYISALWLKWHVESRFHYQRVKEVVYVLETAYCMKNSMNHTKVLDSPLEVAGTHVQDALPHH
jgi:hypothetical protein